MAGQSQGAGIKCRSNLRQLCIALNTYAGNYEGALPYYQRAMVADNAKGAFIWCEALALELGQAKLGILKLTCAPFAK